MQVHLNGRLGIGTGHVAAAEPRAVLRQRVEMGSADVGRPLHANVGVPHIVADNQEDVGFSIRLCVRSRRAHPGRQDQPGGDDNVTACHLEPSVRALYGTS